MTNDNLTLEELDIAECLLQGYEALGRWEGANVKSAYTHKANPGEPPTEAIARVRRASTVRAGAHTTLAGFFAALSLASAHKDPIAAWVLNRALRGDRDATEAESCGGGD